MARVYGFLYRPYNNIMLLGTFIFFYKMKRRLSLIFKKKIILVTHFFYNLGHIIELILAISLFIKKHYFLYSSIVELIDVA